MTHIHTNFFSSIIHIFESARNPLHFFPVQESRMSDTGVLHEVNAYDYYYIRPMCIIYKISFCKTPVSSQIC